ncbi:MAG: hypothetical protein GDA56_21910 [Hormoscilla sp. GM7CHS1pb]|nr:hypothetical protein [Hormoscilla sp. GM7CHS1pb]
MAKPTDTEAIAIDSNDHLWVTGQFHESIDLDGDGNNDLTSDSSFIDSYVAQFDSCGFGSGLKDRR